MRNASGLDNRRVYPGPQHGVFGKFVQRRLGRSGSEELVYQLMVWLPKSAIELQRKGQSLWPMCARQYQQSDELSGATKRHMQEE